MNQNNIPAIDTHCPDLIQRQHRSPNWRAADDSEKQYIDIHWAPIFSSPKLSKSDYFILYPLAAWGVGAILGVIFIDSISFSLCAGGISLLCMLFLVAKYKKPLYKYWVHKHFTHNKYQVCSADARNLKIATKMIDNKTVRYAYVDVYREELLTVENAEIPIALGSILYEQNRSEFPCILIKIQGVQSWLALPKFK